MIAALDVHYPGADAIAACVSFRAWTDAVPESEHVTLVSGTVPYVPGRFFERELPCLLAVLRTLAPPDMLVIDGNVTLDAAGKKGLGAHLYEALGARAPIIGVAKTLFRGAPVVPVLRGKSARPLYVTAMGISPTVAAQHIESMHGPHRIPTLLRRADALSRATPPS